MASRAPLENTQAGQKAEDEVVLGDMRIEGE
jgi:hypothetical protein